MRPFSLHIPHQPPPTSNFYGHIFQFLQFLLEQQLIHYKQQFLLEQQFQLLVSFFTVEQSTIVPLHLLPLCG